MLDATHFNRVQKLAYSSVVICASAAYVRSVVRRCRPGRSRLLSALPILICNFYLPTVFRNRSDIVICALVCLCQLWLCNLKVLALCFERGSLCEQYSPLQFLAVFALPVTPNKGENAGQQGSQRQFVGSLLTKFVIWLALTYSGLLYSNVLPQIASEVALAVSIYTFIGFIYDGLQVVLAQAIGLHIAPQFNKPYVAESLASFWGKRWNLPMGICLRQAVYEPISQGQLMLPDEPSTTAKPSPVRRLSALCSSFAVSGMAHEVMFWYLMGQHTPGSLS